MQYWHTGTRLPYRRHTIIRRQKKEENGTGRIKLSAKTRATVGGEGGVNRATNIFLPGEGRVREAKIITPTSFKVTINKRNKGTAPVLM
jgi:hypothetical protein